MYIALAMQSPCYAVNKCEGKQQAREQILSTIKKLNTQVSASKRFMGNKVKLVVFPEYFLTGFPMGDSVKKWQEFACLEKDGVEYQELCKLASDNNIYLSGNCYEIDENFPHLFFQISFIINDSGEVILKYRRLISTYSPTPHDVLDRYIEIYGKDSLFPVADTPLGRLACVASEEILFPEITRALCLNGAEVICHSSSEVSSALPTPKYIAKIARAYENHSYIVSANSAGVWNTDFPPNSTDAGSMIVDYLGKISAESGSGETMAANGYIHLDALRDYRKEPGMFNILSRQRLELFKDTYSQSVYPANTLLNKQQVTHKHYHECQSQAIKKLFLSDKGDSEKSNN